MPRFDSHRLATAMVENAVAGGDAHRVVLAELGSLLDTRKAAKSGPPIEERLAAVRDLLAARSPATVRRGGDELRALLDERTAADSTLVKMLARRSRAWTERLRPYGRGVPTGRRPDSGPPDIAYGRPPGPPADDDDW